ncbi:hypothetical protein OG252_50975 [Streptomyces sp. NBC_01352]|uniref:alcohol dehydrogenase catalytic domain-containing protein n=1 Tax=Streptomyces sp. NBC_01352 TaxID=2903834 RepID=UPI002E305744|nr:alcohol dehydrogenase catalytic domain-containing protein [Streptomyces sp. NBC_01352]
MPEPGSGQVRIRVAAAAVNPVDIQTRSAGLTAGGLLTEREITGLGWDIAGTVDALGPDVVGFRPGDPVIGLSDRLALSLKAQTAYVVLDVEAVAAVPAGTDLVAAATLPLGGLTSAQGLVIAAIEPGHTLLVLCVAGALLAVVGVRRNPVAAVTERELSSPRRGRDDFGRPAGQGECGRRNSASCA